METVDVTLIYSNLSDAALAERVCEDDNLACSALMQRHKHSLKFEIKKMIFNDSDVESVLMQAFAKAFICINQYNTQYAFTTWLYKIAKNSCIDFLRKKRVRIDTISIDGFGDQDESGEFMDTLKSNILNPEEQMIRKQRAKALYKRVSTLRPIYRSVIKEFYFKELSVTEVSEALSITEAKVKVSLYRARKELYAIYRLRENV